MEVFSNLNKSVILGFPYPSNSTAPTSLGVQGPGSVSRTGGTGGTHWGQGVAVLYPWLRECFAVGMQREPKSLHGSNAPSAHVFRSPVWFVLSNAKG